VPTTHWINYVYRLSEWKKISKFWINVQNGISEHKFSKHVYLKHFKFEKKIVDKLPAYSPINVEGSLSHCNKNKFH
jgi:hypothetical protein